MKSAMLWILAASLLFGSASIQADEVKPPSNKAVAGQMRKLETTLRELLIDISTPQRFNSKEGVKRTEKNAKALSAMAHDLKEKMPELKDQDPTLKIVSGLFSEQADNAYQSLKVGRREYARTVLKSLTGYCMACHTRNQSGPDFKDSGKAGGLAIKGIDRATYLIATRQFDAGLKELEAMINDKTVLAKTPFDWERAVRVALTVAVRVKKDPDLALRLVNEVIAMPNTPLFFAEPAGQWKKSIEKWKKEEVKKPTDEKGLFTELVRLIAEARSLQKYPVDRSADIEYFRATAVAHDLLSIAPNGPHAAETLYLAGISYEVMQDLGLWDLHEFYYLACIEKSPHTEIAQRCYRQYELSIYLGYTGSSGTSIPGSIQKRLKNLKARSQPLKPALN